MDAISSLLKVIEERKPLPKNPFSGLGLPPFQMLDGGDKSNFRLTWRDESGRETTYRYFTINDRRFYAYYGENKHPVSHYAEINENIGARIAEKLKELGVSNGKVENTKMIQKSHFTLTMGNPLILCPTKKVLWS